MTGCEPERHAARGACQTLRRLLCALALLGLLCPPAAASATESDLVRLNSQANVPVDFSKKLNYLDVIRYSLTRADQLKTTQYDVQTAQLAEKDNFYKLFPKLNITSIYSMPMNPVEGSKSYLALGANSGSYDPISAFFGRSGARLAVKGAKLLHVLAVKRFMEVVGEAFVNLMSCDELMGIEQEVIDVGTAYLAYINEQHQLGTKSSLDVLIADQKLAVARSELSHLRYTRSAAYAKFERQLGIKDSSSLSLDLSASAGQVLGQKEPDASVSFAQFESTTPEYQLALIDEELQRYNIKIAQADHIPKFGLGITAPDPLSTSKTSNVYYAQLSLSIPVWAWGETVRNTERAEIGMKRSDAQRHVKMNSVRDEWDDLRTGFLDSKERCRIADSLVAIRKLELLRAEIGYKAGMRTKDFVYEAQVALCSAKVEALKAKTTYRLARVKLRASSGELLKEHIRVDYDGDVAKN